MGWPGTTQVGTTGTGGAEVGLGSHRGACRLALAEIERGSGQLYDAVVVAACVKVVRENGMRLPE